MMGAKMFMSYAGADRGIAEQVAKSLKGSGVDLPVLPADIGPGEDIGEALRKALQESDAVVVVLSDASVNSAFVMAELGAAIALNKRIVAIKPSALPLQISLPTMSNVQILDAEGMSADEIAATIRTRLMS
jgi:nucleoside 2-deoxyribosyltransferase